jgi:ubiquinone/menaquinone biosynthesis C-methylase UbiE
MLSIEEVKLLIEKLKALRGTDFQKLIDDNLKTLQEFAHSVDAYNTRQIARLDKTRNWFQQDLDWKESHQDSILDQLLDKQIELKINQFGKMGNNLQNCLEIGPGNGRHVLALRAWRLMFFTEVLASCKEKIFKKFPLAHQRLLRFYTTDRTACPDIPNNSCNFVFSWDTFPFFTQEHIAEYLKDIHRVILPGGYGFIHYADCDYDADLAEAKRGYWNYNTKSSMKKLLQDAGYEVIEMDQFRPRANYVIFKKPGNTNPVVYKVVEIPLPRDEEK